MIYTLPTPPQRIFDRQRIWRLTPTRLVHVCDLIATTARKRLGSITTIVGIREGGLAPAQYIGTELDTPVWEVYGRHNATDKIYTQATGDVACEVGEPRVAGTVLVVDDICGTGATLTAVTSQLYARAEPDARVFTATLCRNVGAPCLPDFYCWDVRDWVVFPWEPEPAEHTTPLPMIHEVITCA